MSKQRGGFTLVELLVTITVIGILMGLLIPAVNAARESARRGQCATQMRNLALGAIQHENTKGALPGFVQEFGIFGTPVSGSPGTYSPAPDPSDPGNFSGAVPQHAKVGTWAVSLLPWLDAQPTFEHWSEDRYFVIHDSAGELSPTSGASGTNYHELAAPNLAIFQCPSNPVSVGDFGRNSYIANTGMSHLRSVEHPNYAGSGGRAEWIRHCHVGPPTSSSWTPANVDTLLKAIERTQERANGAFHLQYRGLLVSGQLSLGPKMRLDDFKDGQGNTLLFSENVQAMPWHRSGFTNAVNLRRLRLFGGTKPHIVLPVRSRFTQGMVWHYEDPDCPASTAGRSCANVYDAHRINGFNAAGDIFTVEMNVDNSIDLARPSSAHVDGVNVASADGGTRFLSETIDYRVYQALLTPRGKSSTVPWPEFVYNPE